MTKSQEFIAKHRKLLVSGADFFNPDTTLQSRELYDNAKCRILCIFPTPHANKTVSSTAAALNDFVIEHCPDTFVDFAYMPESEDIARYDKYGIPYAIGNITHLDASHFDIVGFSISILSDILAGPTIVNTFSRCDKPIPTFWSDRKDAPLGTYPIIYAGGITASYSDVCFGKVGDKQAFYDFLYLGACDKTDLLTNRFIEAMSKGSCTINQSDHDIAGYEHKDIPNLDLNPTIKTIQDYIEAQFDCEWVYQPQAYEVKYDKHNRICSNKKINSKARDWVRPYYPHVLPDDLGIGRTIINANGDMAGTAQTQVSEGCSAAGSCSFCAEGNYCSGWTEKTRERILWECRECKKYSAGYKYKPYSFNSNYLTDYKGMLKEFMQIYPKVSFINMRMEELGRDTDAVRMMKMIGSNRIASPMEGFSPRIQNNLLNKCLSEESLSNFMNYLIHAKILELKMGGIYTAYEEDQDFQWLYDFVKGLKDKAAEEGGNFPVRLNVTPLVHYPLTPLEYLERKSARRSYDEQRWFTDFWYDKYKEINLRIKIHGFRFSTFIEQSIVDLGRLLTPLFYKHFIKECRPIYALRSIATPEFIEDLKNLIDLEYHFADRDPEHYISPCHRIRIEMFGSYIPRARRLLRHKRAGNVFDNEPDIRCLKTYDGAVTKCYMNCIKNDTLKIYDDVEMDEEGNLSGNYFELTGCMRCQSNEERRARLARPTPQTANSDDIAATPSLPRVQKIRFIIRRNSDFDLLDPGNTSHSFVAKLLQNSDLLLDNYHSVSAHNMFWQAGPNFKYFCSGFQIVDTVWQSNVLEEVKRVIPLVNESMQSLQILSATDVFMDEKLDVDDYNIFYFETELPTEVLQQASLEYKGEIRVDVGTGAAVELGYINDKTLAPPVFAKVRKTCGYFALPLKYNPINYFSSFVSTAKKLGMDLIASNTDFECVLTVRTTNVACKNCGAENGVISLITGKTLPFGPKCLCKALLTQKVKNGL